MINRVTLRGYVADDPEVRSFESGSRMARIRMATTETIHIRKSGEMRNHTEWHTVIFWGEEAHIVDKSIRKGSLIHIEGALRSREYVNKAGVKQTIVEIAGNKLEIISTPQIVAPQQKKEATPEFIPPKEDLDKLPF